MVWYDTVTASSIYEGTITLYDSKAEPKVKICYKCSGRGLLNYQRATDRVMSPNKIDQSVGPCPACQYKGYWVV